MKAPEREKRDTVYKVRLDGLLPFVHGRLTCPLFFIHHSQWWLPQPWSKTGLLKTITPEALSILLSYLQLSSLSLNPLQYTLISTAPLELFKVTMTFTLPNPVVNSQSSRYLTSRNIWSSWSFFEILFVLGYQETTIAFLLLPDHPSVCFLWFASLPKPWHWVPHHIQYIVLTCFSSFSTRLKPLWGQEFVSCSYSPDTW